MEKQIYLLVYVDDIIAAAPTSELISSTFHKLKESFDVEYLGPLKHYLGLQFNQSSDRKTIYLQQSSYVYNTINKFRQNDANPVYTPSNYSIKLNKEMSPKTKEDEEK